MPLSQTDTGHYSPAFEGGIEMSRDKSVSHEKIIRAAIDEFSEYGYDKASMRRIGDRCGLTAAALYRHFDGKEAMFEAIVEPAVRDLDDWMEAHISGFEDPLSNASGPDPISDLWNRAEIDMIRDLIYPRMDEYSMLINRSAGSKYENYLDELVGRHQEKMAAYLRVLSEKGYNVRDISSDELHILMTAYCTALFEPIAHGYTLADAIGYLDTVEEFFKPGWKAIMGI